MRLNLPNIRYNYFILTFYCLGTIALTWASRHDPFFWDTVQLGSKHAHFFFENGLRWLPLPTDIDSGHPPVFGYYLAVIWAFLGKTLPVSHFAMLPFLLLNVALLWRLGHRIAGSSCGGWLPALVLLDPVFLGQSVLVSPDIVVVTSFLLALEGILAKKATWVALGILCLCATSMRGMMTAAALFSWAVALPFIQSPDHRKLWKNTLPFLPGFSFAAWFLYWHLNATGWIGYHPESPWAGAFKPVGALGFIRNMAVVGWRWLDFGRVGELIVLIGLIVWQIRKVPSKSLLKEWGKSRLAALALTVLVFSLPSALIYQNLSAHRYFLPAFVSLHLLVFQLVAGIKGCRGQVRYFTLSHLPIKAWLIFAILLSLVSGNFWVYPRGVSMGWDSTLAHWPYHALREEAISFVETNKIDFAEVGTAFPNINTGENLLLNGDFRQFSPKEFGRNKYMLASNVFNDFSAGDYETLNLNWKLIWRRKRGAVWMEIYEKLPS